MLISVRAEEALAKYKTDDVDMRSTMNLMFMKDICNWDPNGPHQVFWIDALHRYPYTLQLAPPRGGKTMSTEAVDLYETATNEMEDLRIYAPKLDQCKETLKYHYDWIDRSDLLTAFLRKRNGKPILSSETYEFVNGSNAKLYTILGKMEGHNVTIARVEEFDDWDWEIFTNTITRRMGAANKNARDKRVRITGTIMGEENFFRLFNDKELCGLFMDLSRHEVWGIIDVWLLLSFGGVLDPAAVALQQKLMSPDEWARSMLLKFTESKNFIWRKYIRAGLKRSAHWGIEAVYPERGGRYIRQGGEKIGIGLDCGHGGQSDDSSKYSLQIFSEVRFGAARYKRWLAGFKWAPDVDSETLEKEIIEILSYYKPDGGYGDALKMDLIYSLNRKAWYMGLTSENPEDYPENTPANWDKWWISPIHNNDKTKHEMYRSLQHGIHNLETVFPYFDRKDDRLEAVACKRLLTQLEGIRATKTKGRYPHYAAENSKIGDDDADAAGMAHLWLEVKSGDYVDFSKAKAFGRRTFRLN